MKIHNIRFKEKNLTKIMDIEKVKNKIVTIRNKQVILDRDLAQLYEVDTKRINEQVKRNKLRFPKDFCFSLTKEEIQYVVANCDHLKTLKYSYQYPYAFTEQGVAMLSSVLRSEKAVQVNIEIMRTFVNMRNFLIQNSNLLNKINYIESKQIKLEIETNSQFKELFDKFETQNVAKKEGIFFQGEIFSAYLFISSLIKSAKEEIILIDNYIDETTLDLLSKSQVQITIVTKHYNKTDINKFQKQVTIKLNRTFHDRFLLIDKQVYHFGASLKDAGKLLFAFSKMESKYYEMITKTL